MKKIAQAEYDGKERANVIRMPKRNGRRSSPKPDNGAIAGTVFCHTMGTIV
jgi:hypothetical protein